MSAKKNAKTKKQSSKQAKRTAPARMPMDLEARAEVVEAIETQDPEARAESVEALSDADPAPEITSDAPVIADAPPTDPAPTDAPAPADASPAPEPTGDEFDEMRARVEREKAAFEAAKTQAADLVERAKTSYKSAVAEYRRACHDSKVTPEVEGRGRSPNVSAPVRFEVALDGDAFKISIKGKPETLEVVPLDIVRESPNRAAHEFTEKHIGPKDVVGNKQGSLGNRIRAALRAAAAPTA